MQTGKSTLENHRTVVQYTSAGSGTLIPKGLRKKGFQDGENANAEGGYTCGRYDNTITKGRLPPQETATMFALQVYVEYKNAASVVPDAEWKALLGNTEVFLNHGGIEYDLGRAIGWIGPIQTDGQMEGVREFPEPRFYDGNSVIGIDFETTQDLTAGVVASKDYVIRAEFVAFRGYAAESAGKS